MRRVIALTALAVAATGVAGVGTAAADPIPQPLVGVQVQEDGSVCAGFSYQRPVCTPTQD
jgi:hypothetical protein